VFAEVFFKDSSSPLRFTSCPMVMCKVTHDGKTYAAKVIEPPSQEEGERYLAEMAQWTERAIDSQRDPDFRVPEHVQLFRQCEPDWEPCIIRMPGSRFDVR